ncbi:MAG: cytochrome c biogenesis protein CcsA [Chloroflexi bacterium]|nr:cytochrome c biogenesis protein CcsA [Chloroflexota bacterium]
MKNNHVRNIVLAVSLALTVLAMYMVFIFVPTERTMGIVQRIFYLMLPMGWLAMLAFTIIFINSILYLKKREDKYDLLARSAAELGLVFTTLTLITGSLWARPVWHVWWTWEPRLTTTLVLWVIYIAYFMVRSFASEEHRGATFAAVVGIIGFIDVPIIGMSTSIWRGLHPGAIMFQGGLAPPMVQTLVVSLLAFTGIFSVLLIQLVALKNDENALMVLKKIPD